MKLKPVAWMMIDKLGGESIPRKNLPKEYNKDWWEFQPLYTIPEGYKVVPVEPTPEMTFAGYDACQRVSTVQVGLATLSAIYKAMIEAEQ